MGGTGKAREPGAQADGPVSSGPWRCPPRPFSSAGGSAQGYHPKSKTLPSPSSPPPGPISPHPSLPHSEPQPPPNASYPSIPSLTPLVIPKPQAHQAALAGPSGPQAFHQRDSDRRELARMAKGQGTMCPVHGAWRQVCAQENMSKWNSDEAEQGRGTQTERW